MVIAIRVLPIIRIPKALLIWIAIIALIRITSYSLGFVKYGSFSSLHTISNKLTGALLFLTPLLFQTLGIRVTGVILCIVTTLSASEELLITVKAKELRRDIKSLFEL